MASQSSIKNPVEIVEAMERNFILQGRIFEAGLPGVLWFADNSDGIRYATGLPGGWLNRAAGYDLPLQSIKSAVEGVSEEYRSKQIIADWAVAGSQPGYDFLVQVLTAQRWVEYGSFLGMSLELSKAPEAEESPYAVVPVDNSRALRDWMAVFSDGFSVESSCLSFVKDLYLRTVIDSHYCYEHFVVYEKDKALCCGSVHTQSGIPVIYNVTTLHDQRRRGAATALTKFLIQELQSRGESHAALFAQSVELCGFYERLGFAKCGSKIQLFYCGV